MKKAKTLGLIIALAAFIGGWQLGTNLNDTPQITSSVGGASYGGGGQADRINTALPERTADRAKPSRLIPATRFRPRWRSLSPATPFR